MFFALPLLVLPLRPIDFPVEPIPREVIEGVRVYRFGKGVDRLYQDDRQSVGTWFDGKARRGVDTVLWVSPSLVSRWLGYLEAKEKWPEGELERRWSRIRTEMGGKLNFVVRACAFPKMDILEGQFEEPAKVFDPAEIRMLWTSSAERLNEVADRYPVVGLVKNESTPLTQSRRVPTAQRVEPKVCLLEEQWSRSASSIMAENWWRKAPFGEPLRGEFDRDSDGYQIPLGDFYAATYLASIPIPDGPLAGPSFELRVFRPRKEQVARFSLMAKR